MALYKFRSRRKAAPKRPVSSARSPQVGLLPLAAMVTAAAALGAVAGMKLTERKYKHAVQEEAAPEAPAAPARRKPLVRLLILAVLITAAAVLGPTAARYLKERSDSLIVTAGNFYFNSRELDGSLHRVTADDGGSTASFKFTLRNYTVEGYPTASDISYRFSASNSRGTVSDKCQWSVGGTAVTGGGTLAGGSASEQEITCAIPVEAFDDGAVTVSVISDKPYVRTMTAKLTLHSASGDVVLQVTDPGGANGAVSLTFYNTGTKDYEVKDLTLDGSSDNLLMTGPQNQSMVLVPDPTWENAADGNGVLRVPKGSAVSVILLKKNTGALYRESDFKFTASEVAG